MNTKIKDVVRGSVAEEAGIEKGDIILSINDNEIHDIIDFKFITADDYLEIEVQKPDDEVWIYEIEKDYDEDLGIEFEDGILDKAKSCTNKCVFCFIDQLPSGMRDTLYFKDDDSRLSFLQGNFVTLTNLKDEDIDRIIRYRISPINVSVHTTNGELRKKMLSNRFAGNIYERLKKLSDAGIQMNAQIVSCPGLNAGEELIKTAEDLYKLRPNIINVAAVPVGVTKFREGLFPLKTYDKESARQEIENLKVLQDRYIKETGDPFIRLSDEFYIIAEMDIPDDDFYGSYEQLEDGIGMISYFRNSIKNTISNLDKNLNTSITFITGVSAFDEIKYAADMISKQNSNISTKAYKIINNYFGETITVAGLLTATDIIDQLKDKELGKYIIIPRNMLRANERVFLDDITVDEIEEVLNIKALICSYTGEDLIDVINSIGEEDRNV